MITVPLCGQRGEQQHKRACNLLNGLVQPPTEELKRVLDVGCGLGSWARDVAAHYPYMQIIGIDCDEQAIWQAQEIAREQRLSNVTFRPMNVRQPMDFAGERFDLIFARYLFLHLPRRDWQISTDYLVEHLQPGGYLQLVDGGIEIASSTAWHRLLLIFSQVMAARGQDTSVGMFFPNLILHAGLQLCNCSYHPLLAGAWDASNIGARDLLARFVKVRSLIEQTGLASLEEYDAILEQAKQDAALPDFVAAGGVVSVIGCKHRALIASSRQV